MGSIHRHQSKAVPTSLLKDKLSQLYSLPKLQRDTFRHDVTFEWLWDLKERALLEGRQSIDVPEDCIDVLDKLDQERQKHSPDACDYSHLDINH